MPTKQPPASVFLVGPNLQGANAMLDCYQAIGVAWPHWDIEILRTPGGLVEKVMRVQKGVIPITIFQSNDPTGRDALDVLMTYAGVFGVVILVYSTDDIDPEVLDIVSCTRGARSCDLRLGREELVRVINSTLP